MIMEQIRIDFNIKARVRSLFLYSSFLVHAFSCAYIRLWMHLGSLESTQQARVARGDNLRFSCALQTSRVHP